ncbi:MAG: hydrogenase expression/formation protein HypE [Fimbriimonadaceae bacterium]
MNGPRCPIPISDYPNVLLAHGGGGRLMRDLLQKVFRALFPDSGSHDAALLSLDSGRVAVTTDAFVVRPRFFPGGSIGSLSVHGTVNDLATIGARPVALSAAWILEEGLPMDELWETALAMRDAAAACGVAVVTGDTKVVERGAADGIYIQTTGIGVLVSDEALSPSRIEPGDALVLSGDLGRHGTAVMAAREGLESGIVSDSAPIHEPVLDLVRSGIPVRCVRDVTRGGLASVLNELASESGLGLTIDEARVPVDAEVRGFCEILGLDPLYVACEGRFVAVVSAEAADRAVECLRRHPVSRQATRVGEVRAAPGGRVTMTSRIGVERILDLLSGEQLPRIC